MERPPLPLLTTLRFFAAAEVVAFHFIPSIFVKTKDGWAGPDTFLKGLLSGGWAAVAFFFVLSGFILTYAHAGRTEDESCDVDAPTFWRLRFARIAPVYYLGLLVALPRAIDAGWSSFGGLALVVLFLQAWWPAAATLWNSPAWSLSVECLFYALFPGLARALSRLPRGTLLLGAYALVVLATWIRADFLALPASYAGDPMYLRFQGVFPLLHLPQFVFGMALGRLFLFGPALSAARHAAMLIVGIGLLVLVFGLRPVLPWWTRCDAALMPLFALVILGAVKAASVVPILTHPWAVLLGEASYAMYILHIPIRTLWRGATTAMGVELPGWLDFVLYFVIVTGASIVVFRCIETPLRRAIAGRRRLVTSGP
jgi:peptidoglycan/LPS O-acetylase OafA/YrhL